MNRDRAEFLTEAMGGEWPHRPFNNFSTWDGFGKLKCYVDNSSFRLNFYNKHGIVFERKGGEVAFMLNSEIINPDRFANAVYEFLKSKGE